MLDRVSQTENGGMPPADESAGETPGARQPQLLPQKHGGALLSGGMPGNKEGTGRPKEALRQRMRQILEATLSAMEAALAGERLSRNATADLLADPRIQALSAGARGAVEAACMDHLSCSLTPREIGVFHETLARYGVGTQQEVETSKNEVRYVVRLPARQLSGAPLPTAQAIAVMPAPHSTETSSPDRPNVALRSSPLGVTTK